MNMDKKFPTLILFLIFPLVLGLACNMPNRQSGSAQINKTDLVFALEGKLTNHRTEIYADLGRPDAFDISIVEVEGVPVRRESWRYYQYGAQVDFVEGAALWVVELDPVPEETLFAAWYDPLDFMDGITGAQAIQVATAASPTGVVPQRIDLAQGGQDLVGGFALVGDQIIIGLFEDQVVFVETIALMPEGGEP